MQSSTYRQISVTKTNLHAPKTDVIYWRTQPYNLRLAARSFAPFLRQCQEQGYQVNLIYVWLNSVELAINRVALRVASGGHNIPQEVIRRRYERGRKNFLELYSNLADYWIVYDNTTPKREAVAEKTPNRTAIIYREEIWQQINQQ